MNFSGITLIICAIILLSEAGAWDDLIVLGGVASILFVFFFVEKIKHHITMIGILFTFIGIIWGLKDLNPSDISGSIPNLMAGLSIAFIPSALAVGASILIFWGDKTIDEESQGSEDLLRNISRNIQNLVDKQSDLGVLASIERHLSQINSGIQTFNQKIGGNDEESLIEIIRTGQEGVVEKQEDLNKSFDSFAKEMAENNMKALTESMRHFMDDFNAKINDQLGQSFLQLTNAIDNLLIWQGEYKANIITSTEALTRSKDSLEQSSKGFTTTVKQSQIFADIALSLENQLQTLNGSLEILKSGLQEFSGIADNSRDASKRMIASIDDLKTNFISKAEVMIEESTQHIHNMTETFNSQSEDLKKSHADILQDLRNNVDTTNKNVSEQFERIAKELENQAIKLDDELGNALSKSLSSLGQELTSITDKFTQQLGDLNKVLATK